ncbi:glycosyltransferase family 2 protein [Nocardioides sp. BP30]|uniref:glycosyltransferase family 2 protein n=1 Tax=Nocardioides sp. BP30 TaxID=3036374 RepID=UPI002468B3AC|nr:glycosyltransferase family 2 protein [Nocardioides sp. BP30]WGL52052.1 glycosyltransferase family 2 protein [Nocardioides sp. BP30]
MADLITAIIHTRNEEKNIRRAIESIGDLCEDILVADMNSSDQTVEIARSLGARVIDVPDVGYVEPVRSLAEQAALGEWILRIDADEIVPKELCDKIREVVAEGRVDVVRMCRLNFMFGKRVRGTGWQASRDRHYFLFRRGALQEWRIENGIHGAPQPVADARVADIQGGENLCVWHFNYTDWNHFIEKLNRYSSVEARENLEKGLKPTLRFLARNLMKEVVRRGVEGRPWRDGSTGFGLLWMQLTYRILVFLKMRQNMGVGDRDSIEAIYGDLASEAHR